jgi:hypothetical protein
LAGAICHALIACPATAGLRQREWNREDGEKRKQNERAPEKVRLDGRISLFFHWGCARDFWESPEAPWLNFTSITGCTLTRFYLIPSTGFKENFLRNFGTNHEWTRIGTNNWQRTAPRIRRLVSSGKSEAITGSLM